MDIYIDLCIIIWCSLVAASLHDIVYMYNTSWLSAPYIHTYMSLNVHPPSPTSTLPLCLRYVHPKSSLVVKLDLQLYQIDHKNYLLDFRCVNPPLDENNQSDSSSPADEDSPHYRHFVMEFFEICSRLISSLAQ